MADSLEQIAAEVAQCTRCPLQQGRNKSVPGEGPPDADLMFIGEGPGQQEDQTGRPFVGASGNFLTQMIQSIGLRREDVFICNVVKCRPPGNRDPQENEIEACKAFLDRQIELINPSVVVTLGRFSMARWFPSARISKIHGQPRRVGNRLIVPFFHPAAALHQPSLKQSLLEDFARLPGFIEQVKSWGNSDGDDTPPDADSDDTQQLRLF